MSAAPESQAVLDALSRVQEPELHRDLVSLGMIKDLALDSGRVGFTIELTTPACPLRDQIVREARQAVERPARGAAGRDPYDVQRSGRRPDARSDHSADPQRRGGRLRQGRRRQDHRRRQPGGGPGPRRRPRRIARRRRLRSERPDDDGPADDAPAARRQDGPGRSLRRESRLDGLPDPARPAA